MDQSKTPNFLPHLEKTSILIPISLIQVTHKFLDQFFHTMTPSSI